MAPPDGQVIAFSRIFFGLINMFFYNLFMKRTLFFTDL